MPALKTTLCRVWRWNVGTDDFVVPSLVAVALRVVGYGLLVGVLVYLYISPAGCKSDLSEVPPFLYGSLFALATLEVVVMINEVVIFSISSRGTIHHTKPRSSLPAFLFVRVILFFLEVAVVIVCLFAVYSPSVSGKLDCKEIQNGPLTFARVLLIVLLVVLAIYAVGFLLFIDACNCFTPDFLKDMTHLNAIGADGIHDDKLGEEEQKVLEEYGTGKFHRSKIGKGKLLRRAWALLCCQRSSGHRSRNIALRDLASAIYTVFSDSDVVVSDLFAGLILVNRDQKRKQRECKCLVSEFRDLTFDSLPKTQMPAEYQREEPQPFDFTNKEERLLFDDLIHYMKYSMGIYGWPMYMFDNLYCGCCHLLGITCYTCNFRCCNKRHNIDFFGDNLCMCGVRSMELQAKVIESNILYVNYQNEVFQAPFSVCVDHRMKSVILTVRGTLSIKDALTDLSVSMVSAAIPGCPYSETYVHNGMYRTAVWINGELVKRQILTKTLEGEFWDYQLVITGHSLGAGVASILSLLLRPRFPDLVCYAFSPPGCIFSFPVAVYSRQFITTVVLGNDLIPRVTFRSLLYLKTQVVHLLEICKKSKAQVLYQPRWFDRFAHPYCCQQLDDPSVEMEDIRHKILPKYQTAGGMARFVFGKKAARKWRRKVSRRKGTVHNLVQSITSGEKIASFPPGRVVHIEVEKNAKPCFGGCFPSRMKVTRVSADDLCVIVINRGIVEDHLPNEVLDALKRSQQQLMMSEGLYDAAELEEMRSERANGLRSRRAVQMEEKNGTNPVVTQPNGDTATVPIEADLSNGTTADREAYKRIIALELEPPGIDAPVMGTVELEERGEQIAITFEPAAPPSPANGQASTVL